jgi:hypothetical protein
MKKLISSAFLGALLVTGAGSCKKKSSTSNNNNSNSGSIVEVPIDRSDTTTLTSAIPALPVVLDFMNPASGGAIPGGPMLIDTFATKVDEYITPYGFAKKDMQKVNLTALRINIENAPSQYFNFVKDTTPVSIKIFVDSFAGTSPKMVAYKNNIPWNANSLELTVDPSDIKDYFNADYMKIMIGFYTRPNEGLDGNAKFRVNYTFKITAKMP